MAGTVFSTIQFFHITSAAVVLGYLAFAPLWRAAVARSTEPAVHRHTVDLMKKGLLRMVYPAFAVLVVSGIAMSFRSTSDRLYDLREVPWLQASVLLAVVLGVMLWGLLGPLRKMAPFLEANEPKGAATDKLWSDWRTSLMMASLIALVTTALMIYNAVIIPGR